VYEKDSHKFLKLVFVLTLAASHREHSKTSVE